MILSEFFTALSFGPISNLSMASEGFGTIKEESKSKVVFHLNNALNMLYTKFVLKENELLITTIADQWTYLLGDAVVKPLKVYTEMGQELPINDENNIYSCFTPQPQVLQIPDITATVPGKKLAVIYQARHTTIDVEDEDSEIILPTILNNILFKYVAAEIFSDMVGQDNMVKAQELKNSYKELMNDVKENDLVTNSISTTIIRKFEQKGFV